MHSPTNEPSTMGKVYTAMTVTNRADQILAKNGMISPDAVRSITIKNVLVDTGATTLCLPGSVIAQLGLELAREVVVETALGTGTARIFKMQNFQSADEKGRLNVLNCQGEAALYSESFRLRQWDWSQT